MSDAADIVVIDESAVSSGAHSRVGGADLRERLPRSVPDALRFEPGVFVQQTGHGQASPYIRGRTGQQTLMTFDGIRLNNSTWRQGPNQYLFTVDARSVASLEVSRGGASTRWGSDAIGGAIHVHPLEPAFEPLSGTFFRPRAMLRAGSADGELGERFQLDAQLSPTVQVLTGIGFRRIGRLRSGGAVHGDNGTIPQVPAFESDGATMLGTGFRELTWDGRLAARPFGTGAKDVRLIAAAYVYRQYDAPRTDQCPPPFAPRSECLRFMEQFRTLAYVGAEWGGESLPRGRVVLSYQRQHELRRRDRPGSFIVNGGRDDVDTLGVLATADSKRISFAPWLEASFGGGVDLYHDRIASMAWTRLTDIATTVFDPRGQYLDGSRYAQGGGFVSATALIAQKLTLRTGGRLGFARADAPADPQSGTAPVARTFTPHAAFLQGELALPSSFSVVLGWDRSFRAPNLDDLTGRQQSGPGFQFENPSLQPEVADTFEAGVRLRSLWLTAEAWVFQSFLDDAITRSVRLAEDCPPATPQCGASWNRFRLVNVAGRSTIRGAELTLRARLGAQWTARGTMAWALGDGPNPQPRPSDPNAAYAERVPLSRVPPLNGTAELRWTDTEGTVLRGVFVGGAVRWALAQSRLAPSDYSDARIPEGGTPGFAVFDARLGYRLDRRFVFTVVAENLANAPYRYHGSSIQGAGRSLLAGLEVGL